MDKEHYALITGASRGIGRAIATVLASRGHNLALHSLPGEGLSNLSDSLMKEYGIKVLSFETDLTEPGGPGKLRDSVKSSGISINILVNNAGTGIEGPFESCENHIDNIIFLNIRALTMLTCYFLPELKKTDSYILNLSSFGIYVPTPYKSIYLASKSYIFYFTRALDAELKGTSVRTCVFVPSAVRTNDKVLERIDRAGWLSKASSISPEEVASKGIKAMFKGKKVYMPGNLTRFIFAIGNLLPQGVIQATTRNIFRREYPV
ncbi:MAG TPA: SDR family NAD(P)-dependent oxidoreductase [Bacteroidales bacterium]|nr:SDR family NAD(P)-dependent oxidoreductase [Bacteroidales bacterium]